MPTFQFDILTISGNAYDEIVRQYKDTVFTVDLTDREFMEQVSMRVHRVLGESVSYESSESFCKDMIRAGVFREQRSQKG